MDSVVDFRRLEEMRDAFSAFDREGLQSLIARAVQADFDEFLAGFSGQTNAWGRSAVVRSGFLPEHSILTGIGPLPGRIAECVEIAQNFDADGDIVRGHRRISTVSSGTTRSRFRQRRGRPQSKLPSLSNRAIGLKTEQSPSPRL